MAFDKQELSQDSLNTLFQLFPLFHRWAFQPHPAAPEGLTKTQWLILMALSGKDSFSMSELARMIRSSKEQCTRAVAPLVDHEYVVRFQNHSNRRMVLVSLSDKGRRYIRSIRKKDGEAMLLRLQQLSDEDLTKFNQSLHNLHTILTGLTEHIEPTEMPPFPPI